MRLLFLFTFFFLGIGGLKTNTVQAKDYITSRDHVCMFVKPQGWDIYEPQPPIEFQAQIFTHKGRYQLHFIRQKGDFRSVTQDITTHAKPNAVITQQTFTTHSGHSGVQLILTFPSDKGNFYQVYYILQRNDICYILVGSSGPHQLLENAVEIYRPIAKSLILN